MFVPATFLSRNGSQLSFLPEVAEIQRQEQLEKAVDTVRKRFGHFSLQRGIASANPDLCSINPKDDHIIHPESFFGGF